MVVRVIPEIVPPKHMKRAYFDPARREYVFVLWPFNYVVVLAWWLNCWWCHYTRKESWIDRLAWVRAEHIGSKHEARIAARDAYISDQREELKRLHESLRRERLDSITRGGEWAAKISELNAKCNDLSSKLVKEGLR